jgi:hypothetical protein
MNLGLFSDAYVQQLIHTYGLGNGTATDDDGDSVDDRRHQLTTIGTENGNFVSDSQLPPAGEERDCD